jgi:hypothetical protein
MNTGASRQTVTNPQCRAFKCIAVIVVTSLIGFFIAVGFYTPYWNGYVQLPGVIVAAVSATICTTAFLLCPSRPMWVKMLTLALLVPSLWFAVYCGMGLIYPGFL